MTDTHYAKIIFTWCRCKWTHEHVVYFTGTTCPPPPGIRSPGGLEYERKHRQDKRSRVLKLTPRTSNV